MSSALKMLFSIVLIMSCLLELPAQSDTAYLNITSKMWFVSVVDNTEIMMDEEGNQFDHSDTYIDVEYQGKKLRIPYKSNFVFWDEYDENMNVKKIDYNIIIQQITITNSNKKTEVNLSLFKVYEGKRLIYDVMQMNPYKP